MEQLINQILSFACVGFLFVTVIFVGFLIFKSKSKKTEKWNADEILKREG